MAIIIVFACAVDKRFVLDFSERGPERRVAMCRVQKNVDLLYSLTTSSGERRSRAIAFAQNAFLCDRQNGLKLR